MLPDDIKKVLASMPIVQTVQDISTRNNLHVDQSGDLYMETMLVMLGVEKTSDLAKNIQKQLKTDWLTASSLAKQISDQIFLPVRVSLQKMTELINKVSAESNVPVQVVEKKVDVTHEDREQILSDIENPTKTAPTDNRAKQNNSNLPVVETPEEESIVLMRKKLTETTSSPMQHVVIKEETPIEQTPKVEKSKSYVADPYREPIN